MGKTYLKITLFLVLSMTSWVRTLEVGTKSNRTNVTPVSVSKTTWNVSVSEKGNNEGMKNLKQNISDLNEKEPQSSKIQLQVPEVEENVSKIVKNSGREDNSILSQAEIAPSNSSYSEMQNANSIAKSQDSKIVDDHSETKNENLELKNLTAQTIDDHQRGIHQKACDCADLGTLKYYCSCTKPGGLITNSGNLTGTFTYNIVVEPEEKLIVYFSKDDVLLNSTENCSLSIGNKLYSNSSMVLEDNAWMTEKTTNVTGLNGDGKCQWRIKYRVSTKYNETSEETSLKGLIEAPVDPDGLQQYRPRIKRLWNFAPNVLNCSLEINVTKLDLGSNSNFLDDTLGGENDSKADFLVIGAGEVSISSPVAPQDTVLHGGSESPLVFTYEECSAHVLFVSDMHYQNVAGFQITYTATNLEHDDENGHGDPEQEERKEDLVINILVNLNGVVVENVEDMTNLTVKFKESIADLANIYAQEKKIDLQQGEILTDNNIVIHEVRECSVYCGLQCTSFNFSIRVAALQNGEYILSEDVLNLLLRRRDLHDRWRFQNYEVCDADQETSWRWFGLGGLINVMIILVIVSLVWKTKEVCTTRNSRNRADSEIGHLSVSSQVSTNNRRFNMPLPRRKKEDLNSEPLGWNYNVSGFTQFDPVGERVDPITLGLDEPNEDYYRDRQSVTFYSNTAYEGDENELFSQAAARGLPVNNANNQIISTPMQPVHEEDAESEVSDFEPFESSL